MEKSDADEVERLMELDKYEHALASLEPHITEAVGSVEAWWLAARCLAPLKQYREVVKYCDRILARDNQHRDALLLKGVAQLEGGFFADALSTAKSAMPIVEELSFGERWPWLLLLGAAEYRNGAYSEAAETLDSSLQSWALGTMLTLLLQPFQPAPDEWYEVGDASPCVLYAAYALLLWPPGQYCETTNSFREISELGWLGDEAAEPLGEGVQFFYDEVLNDNQVKRVVSPRYIEAFKAKCHETELYSEMLAYRAKALLALDHEDAEAYCEEVRSLDPKLLEEE